MSEALPTFIERVRQDLGGEGLNAAAQAVNLIKQWSSDTRLRDQTRTVITEALHEWENAAGMAEVSSVAEANVWRHAFPTDTQIASLGTRARNRLTLAQGALPPLRDAPRKGLAYATAQAAMSGRAARVSTNDPEPTPEQLTEAIEGLEGAIVRDQVIAEAAKLIEAPTGTGGAQFGAVHTPTAAATPLPSTPRGGSAKGRAPKMPKAPKAPKAQSGQQGQGQYDDSKHPRTPAGRPGGGQFMAAGEGMGAEGPSPRVAQAQKRLQQVGQSPGAADGRFGPQTQSAVGAFQAKYGLPVNGQIDAATAAVMQNPPQKSLAQIQAENAAVANTPNAQGQVASHANATSAGQAGVQARQAGATGPVQSGGSAATGGGRSATPSTTTLNTGNNQAVRQFQASTGLTVDGIVGPQTIAAMKGAGVSSQDGHIQAPQQQAPQPHTTTVTNPNGTTTTTTTTPGVPKQQAPTGQTKRTRTRTRKAAGSQVLKQGASGSGVRAVQKTLDTLGYDLGSAGVDGKLGPETDKAVRTLQRKYGLKVDGKVGPRTQRLLKRLSQKQAQPPKKGDVVSGDQMKLSHALTEAALTEAGLLSGSRFSAGPWDSRKHPRDRAGRFHSVLRALQRNEEKASVLVTLAKKSLYRNTLMGPITGRPLFGKGHLPPVTRLQASADLEAAAEWVTALIEDSDVPTFERIMEIDDPGALQEGLRQWLEQLHPRDRTGKFAHGEGLGGGHKTVPAPSRHIGSPHERVRLTPMPDVKPSVAGKADPGVRDVAPESSRQLAKRGIHDNYIKGKSDPGIGKDVLNAPGVHDYTNLSPEAEARLVARRKARRKQGKVYEATHEDQIAAIVQESFAERLHPRDRNGKFASAVRRGRAFVASHPSTRFTAQEFGHHARGGKQNDAVLTKLVAENLIKPVSGLPGTFTKVPTGAVKPTATPGLDIQNKDGSLTSLTRFNDSALGHADRHSGGLLVGERNNPQKVFPRTFSTAMLQAKRNRPTVPEAMGQVVSLLQAFDDAHLARIEAQASGDTHRLIQARALEVARAKPLVEGKAISAEARKASATVVRKKKDGSTEYKFPIGDKGHARAALARLNQSDLSPAEKAKVKAKAKAKLAEAPEYGAPEHGKPKSQRQCKMPHDAMSKRGKVKCPGCGARIGKVAKTVEEAAHKLKCPKCGHINPADAKVCAKCGHNLDDARKAKFANMDESAEDAMREALDSALRGMSRSGMERQGEAWPGAAGLDEAKDSLAKASTPEPFSTSKTSNWVARGGGLPAYIQHIAHDLVEKRGKTESEAIQMAIGIVKRWARGGGNVDANTRAAASKAVAQWEALKAKSHAKG